MSNIIGGYDIPDEQSAINSFFTKGGKYEIALADLLRQGSMQNLNTEVFKHLVMIEVLGRILSTKISFNAGMSILCISFARLVIFNLKIDETFLRLEEFTKIAQANKNNNSFEFELDFTALDDKIKPVATLIANFLSTNDDITNVGLLNRIVSDSTYPDSDSNIGDFVHEK